MPVIEESGGRLNAFAKEPKMEVITGDSGIGGRIFLITGIVLVAGLILFAIHIS
tara:strand:- start:268 stop:429 length:162 start_codon:yes stop_codon:yes gene_type:complete